MINRLFAALMLAGAAWAIPAVAGGSDIPQVVEGFRQAHDIPGGVVAYGPVGGTPRVLVIGSADPEGATALAEDARFRLASLTKPLTAAAVLKLAAQGRVALDAPISEYLSTGAAADPRMGDITLRQLLAHTAGFDRDRSFDPILSPDRLDLSREVPCAAVAAATIGRLPLDHPPGTRQVYSNIGYCLASEIVSGVTGAPFEAALRDLLDLPGLTIGGTSVDHWTRREGTWLRLPGTTVHDSYFARLGGAGGATLDAPTFWRFAARAHPALDAPPPPGALRDDYYALGWRVWPGPEGRQLTHSGFVPGIFSFVARFSDDTIVVALFNGGVEDGIAAFFTLYDALCEAQGIACR